MQSTHDYKSVTAVPIDLPSSSKPIFGHDRQPSVQLKIEASGGPPLQAKVYKSIHSFQSVNFLLFFVVTE